MVRVLVLVLAGIVVAVQVMVLGALVLALVTVVMQMLLLVGGQGGVRVVAGSPLSCK